MPYASGICTSDAKFVARFSRTMPSEAAKKAKTCLMKWRSEACSCCQSAMSRARSISL